MPNDMYLFAYRTIFVDLLACYRYARSYCETDAAQKSGMIWKVDSEKWSKKQLVILVYIGDTADTVILLTIGIVKSTWKSRSQPTRISRGWDSRTSVSSGGKHRKRRRNKWRNGDLQTAFQKSTEKMNSSSSSSSSSFFILQFNLLDVFDVFDLFNGFLCWICLFLLFHWKRG